MGELTLFLGLQVKQKPDGIFISQDKYVAKILKKFDFASVKTASTPIETQKPLVKDEEASDVDVHLYRSMIGSLMYMTASRPDIMFAVCACSRFQVTPKTSHLSVVKRIFRYLKGKPKLGLWYPSESLFDLESYSDSDYAGANLDRKSTTGATGPRNCVVPNRKPKGAKRLFIKKQHHRKSWLLFKSKKIAQVVSAWIKSKNSLVKHFEDMRLCRPSKEYLQVKLVSMVDDKRRSRRFRESLRRVTDGAEAFLILTLFILCLDKVSTDHAKSSKPIRIHLNRTLTQANFSNSHSSLQALISLTDDLSLLSNMAALESCPKHNMIAYLEKTEGNVEFHEVIDFLRRSYIFHALTVSPVVSTTLVEQFWTSAKSKTINNVRYITAKVAGKVVSISEASIRTDLIFDDADGTDTLPNQAIFNAIQLMGYEGDLSVLTFNKALFSPQWRLSVEQPSPSPTPTGEIPNESLPDSSSAQPSEVPFEHHPDTSPSPSPRPSPTPIVPDSIPEPTGENLGDHSSNDASLSGNEDDMTLQNVYDLCISLCQQVSDQAKEIKLLKAKIKKLKKKAKPVIKHYQEYLKITSLQQRFPKKSFSKKQRVHKKNVSKQGRKKAKGESSVQRDPMFEVLAEDKIDQDAQTEGRTRDMVEEEKEFDEERLSTEDEVSTVKEGVSTDFEKVSTDRPKVSTDESKVSTDEQVEGTDESNESTEEIFEGTEDQREGTKDKVSTDDQMEGTEDETKEEIASKASQTSTQTPTSMTFGDDETIATLLINMSKAKAASKEKEKGVELKDVEEIDRPKPTSTRSLLTLKPLPKIDPKDKGKKKIEEEEESESEDDDIPQVVKKFKLALKIFCFFFFIGLFIFFVSEVLARKIQEDWEAEEERSRIAEETATNEALIKDFDDIQARIEADRILAEKLQEQEREQFSIEERAKFLHDTIAAQRKFLAQQRSEAIRNRPPTKNQLRNQMMTFLKHVGNFKHSELKSKKFEDIQAMYEKIKRFKQDTSQDDPSDTEKENEELRLCLTIAPDEDKEVDYEILDKKYPIIDWKSENLGTKPQFDESKRLEQINMNVGQLILEVPNPNEHYEFWNSQHEWKIISKEAAQFLRVPTFMTEEVLDYTMLIEKKNL
ncbi:hypothetical protein Tco_0990328 [Tanacetum coccineum]|uniref:Reverse transcriptase Ty1/copia-type domain-containing protein n=1 Tax=Tanacetum coccineum TaxID=301880 RepID=A0ABQ5EWJ5_9ASTR